MKLTDITQPNWTLSLKRPGEIVTGVDAISQNIIVIAKTQRGTDPLRPNFGTDFISMIDGPVNERVPVFIKDLVDSVAIWETRADITNVSYSIGSDGRVYFEITWTERDTETTTTTKFTINGTN
jgi:phage baseplate assembly protein W